MSIHRVAVLLTCYNRRDSTLASLRSLFTQEGVDDMELSVFLTDDGSRDGTAAAVAEEFPSVHLLRGDGTLFWNGGMRKAFSAAMEEQFDAYIWYNDDTVLFPDALRRILNCARDAEHRFGSAIVVASMQERSTSVHSYGGFLKKAHGLRLEFVHLPPDPELPLRCSTMNGNFTLIPASVVARLGNLDATFRHQLGDVDYGLRATSAGIPILVAPGYFGYCSDNSQVGTWRDSSLPLSSRWRNLMSPKGAPPREWFVYTWRHFGWRWPLYALSPYVKTLLAFR